MLSHWPDRAVHDRRWHSREHESAQHHGRRRVHVLPPDGAVSRDAWRAIDVGAVYPCRWTTRGFRGSNTVAAATIDACSGLRHDAAVPSDRGSNDAILDVG